MKTSYHNTTGIQGEQLELFEEKAANQEEIILALFKQTPRMTASECLNRYPCDNTPLTSIRRGMTNLMNKGKLIKTEEKKTGTYGRPEYIYEFKL